VTNWVVIPIKALDACKTRLRPALGDAERRALVRAMLANVIEAALNAERVDRVALLGPEQHSAPDTVTRISEPGSGLNVALGKALSLDATRIVIVAADLPRVTAADIDALAGMAADVVAIAPDRAGAGTNALSLPMPAARGFAFQFGAGSFARHATEVERLGLKLEVVRSATLALDVDTPADLAELS